MPIIVTAEFFCRFPKVRIKPSIARVLMATSNAHSIYEQQSLNDPSSTGLYGAVYKPHLGIPVRDSDKAEDANMAGVMSDRQKGQKMRGRVYILGLGLTLFCLNTAALIWVLMWPVVLLPTASYIATAICCWLMLHGAVLGVGLFTRARALSYYHAFSAVVAFIAVGVVLVAAQSGFPSDHYLGKQWEGAAKAEPNRLCSMQNMFGCSGWNTTCANNNITGPNSSCIPNCKDGNVFTATCKHAMDQWRETGTQGYLVLWAGGNVLFGLLALTISCLNKLKPGERQEEKLGERHHYVDPSVQGSSAGGAAAIGIVGALVVCC